MEKEMMKVKVIKRYNDMVLKKIQKVGTELEVTQKRGEWLISQGMVEEVKAPQETKGTVKETDPVKNTGKA